MTGTAGFRNGRVRVLLVDDALKHRLGDLGAGADDYATNSAARSTTAGHR
ncbi:hypothetical protein [Streptomyces shaanxiensis]|uniref:Uncharacterized protein n=1 Tax=Streptomyces shaanxiensis TaxID=653357 RepID=A0ABP7UEP3_9ACTN